MKTAEFLSELPTRMRGPKDNIAEIFLRPALKICKLYRRNTAWFRQSAMGIYAPSLRHFIDNDSKMEMLVSLTGSVDSNIIEALEKTVNEKARTKVLLAHGNKMIRTLTGLERKPSEKKFQHHLLIYLLATKKLEIRFAITKQYPGAHADDFFHEKAGYITFEGDQSLAFIGNFNESAKSISTHGERIHIFKSSKVEQDEDRMHYIEDLNLQWDNKDDFTEVHKLNSDTLKEIKKYSLTDDQIKDERRRWEKKKQKESTSMKVQKPMNVPVIPELYNGKPFKIRPHQTKALKNWKDNGFNGIFEHVTGSGKTITAIYGICKFAEHEKTAVIISVPYISLADQWVDELKAFNIMPIQCYESSNKWFSTAEQSIARFASRPLDKSYLLVLVVVNKTLNSEKFQSVISQLNKDNLIYIGDECHRYAKKGGTSKLPKAEYRLGLSGTPFSDSEFDVEGNEELINFFGRGHDIFTIKMAMAQGALCEYFYYPISIYLSEEEYERYTENVGKIHLVSKDSDSSDLNMAAIAEMSRALGSAQDKFIQLRKLLRNEGMSGRSIVFCGDGSTELESLSLDLSESENKDRENANAVLQEQNIICNYFTSEESSKRRREILKDFTQGDTQCLISIRVLDEGIDVPGVESAYLLASSRNRRQYIQRRGRVLRKSDEKEFSKIYDFICLPPKDINKSAIVDGEIKRLIEMTDDSKNKDDNIKFIKKLIDSYQLDEKTLDFFSNTFGL